MTDDIVDELADNMAPLGKMIEGIDDEAMLILKKHNWPGNVRELENVIEYAVNMEKGREPVSYTHLDVYKRQRSCCYFDCVAWQERNYA